MVPSVKQSGVKPTGANIVYGSQSTAQSMDLYRPPVAGVVPAVLYIHGGGFRFGTRDMASASLIKGFLAAGYVVLSVDYRLYSEAKFPAAVQDVFSAMAYVKTHHAQLQIDPENVAVYGESAGANLGSLLGAGFENPLFKSAEDEKVNLKPVAVIAHYPPVDFLQIDPMLEKQGCQLE